MAQPKLNSLPKLFFTGILAAINGSIIALLVLKNVVQHGYSRYFYVKKRERPPACLANPSLGTHAFVRLKSVRLHYVYGGQEGRPLMVFLHGFPEFWYSWRHQLPEFASDYRVVAVDMRGYGESDKPDGVSNYFIDSLAEDIKDLVEALGYETCVLVGHDWGGAVGFRVCQMFPELVKTYISINIPHPVAFKKHIETHLSQALKSWYMLFFNIPWLPEAFLRSQDLKMYDDLFNKLNCEATPEEDVEAYKYTMGKPGALTGPVNYYRATFRYAATKEAKTKLPMPVLTIWGKQDAYLEYKAAEDSVQYMENYTLKFIDDGAHWVQMEKPEVVNKYMREFLSQQAG